MQQEATVSNNYVEKTYDGKLQTARRNFHETINSASSLSVSSSFMKGSLFSRCFVFVPRFLRFSLLLPLHPVCFHTCTVGHSKIEV